MRKQGIILEHQPDPATLGGFMPPFAFNQPAADENEPGIGTFEPSRYPKSGRFAAARGS
jgi:hypothetical protein